MIISTEKTPDQKLSKNILESVSAINVTHLPGHSLEKVAIACDKVNQKAGIIKSVPHVAARNVSNLKELKTFIHFCSSNHIKNVLVIGGSVPRFGQTFENDWQIRDILKKEGFQVNCGLYPQNENISEIKRKLMEYDGAVTQVCMNKNTLMKLPLSDKISIGIPSMCTAKGIYKYLRLCGNKSYKYVFKNWKASLYLSSEGLRVDNFVKGLPFKNYHIYNFGKLEKTIENVKKVVDK